MNVPMNKITANNNEAINNSVYNQLCPAPRPGIGCLFSFGKPRNSAFLFENRAVRKTIVARAAD